MVLGQKNIIKINLGITHWKCQKLNQKKENNENFILCHSGTNIYYRRLVLGRFIFISMLKPGETCLTANYGINIGNYLALGWNNYFQWFSNIEQMPCRITFAAWCLYFLSCFPAYALLKVYGMFKLSITLKYKFVISEYIFYIALFMIWLFLQPGLVLTSYSFINALIGVLLLFVPFILCSVFIIYGCNMHIMKLKSK